TYDVVNLFHFLTGGARGRADHRLLGAPRTMRERLLGMVGRGVGDHRAGKPGRVSGQPDPPHTRGGGGALGRGSGGGRVLGLIVRGCSVLAAGVPGATDNVRISSVIGRFLEHSRIYFFQNGSEEPVGGEFYIGSADWMRRNLSERVEAVTPVEAAPLRARLWEILDVMLRDHRQAWDMRPDCSYVKRTPAGGAPAPTAGGAHHCHPCP